MVRGGEQQVCTDNMDFVREKVKDWEIKGRLHKVNPLTSHESEKGQKRSVLNCSRYMNDLLHNELVK